MNRTPVLVVDGVSKTYPVYRSNLLRFAKWFGVQATPVTENYAIRDVSFSVYAGESMAIIGANGAGKSTLLKLITGTVRASSGQVSVAGRISAILELGLGFNGEFTGRQNVYLAGGLMGFGTDELTALMPEIEAFTELGPFFDQQLRVYSSGMHARLAFAVATAVRPQILIVDEVLSVGDSYFQHKSFDRIRQFRAAGTSILFVSHGMSDVRELCDRVLLLENGSIAKAGEPDEVIDYYSARVSERDTQRMQIEQTRRGDGWLRTVSGSNEVEITDVSLFDADSNAPTATVEVGTRLKLVAKLFTCQPVDALVVGFMLKDRTGHVVWGSNTWHTGQVVERLPKGETVEVALTFEANFGPGSYGVTCAAHGGSTHLDSNFNWIDNVVVFDVVNLSRPRFSGSVYLDARFESSHG